ncbi:hypothetical protein [Streptomyces achromogenes]|uniref:hypothetical protein n=1 Tax=Streptomyces achromogenes TaxID=67255 RepID=UPI003688F9D4
MTESVDRTPAAPARAAAVRDGADGTLDRAAAGTGERRPGTAEAMQAPAGPDAMRVWSWSASVTLSGYGPTVSDFL